jgi:hypothetical protein
VDAGVDGGRERGDPRGVLGIGLYPEEMLEEEGGRPVECPGVEPLGVLGMYPDEMVDEDGVRPVECSWTDAVGV